MFCVITIQSRNNAFMFLPAQLQQWLADNDQPSYRYKQIMQALFSEGKRDFSEILTLPKDLRTSLSRQFTAFVLKEKIAVHSQNEDCTKVLLELPDGEMIESVLMEFEDGRASACVSSQVGCALKCAFCATGDFGFRRQLSSLEIFEQVWWLSSILQTQKRRLSNLVFMGMGEPLLNYDAVVEAIRMINDPDMIGLGMRHITVSTSGIAPQIIKLGRDLPQINLAVSLHAPVQALRERIMPIAKKYHLDELFAAIETHIAETHRRVTYEYLLIDQLNDTDELAHTLGKKIGHQNCHVNLIPWNKTNHPDFKPSSRKQIFKFARILEEYQVPVTIRVTIGADIDAACGQLANKAESNTTQPQSV